MGGWAGVGGREVCGRTGRGRRCGADVGAGYEVLDCARCAHCRAHPVPTPRARQVCHAFSVDLYAPPEVGEVFDNLDDELFPPPPPPPLVQRCPSSELFIGTDAHFRQQHGVHKGPVEPAAGGLPHERACVQRMVRRQRAESGGRPPGREELVTLPRGARVQRHRRRAPHARQAEAARFGRRRRRRAACTPARAAVLQVGAGDGERACTALVQGDVGVGYAAASEGLGRC